MTNLQSEESFTFKFEPTNNKKNKPPYHTTFYITDNGLEYECTCKSFKNNKNILHRLCKHITYCLGEEPRNEINVIDLDRSKLGRIIALWQQNEIERPACRDYLAMVHALKYLKDEKTKLFKSINQNLSSPDKKKHESVALNCGNAVLEILNKQETI